MKVGYARVSREDQSTDAQLDALRDYGCEMVFHENACSVKERPELEKALEYLRSGDIFVAVRLDRIGRSLPDIIKTVLRIRDKGANFVSLSESIDTSTSTGRFVFHVFASLAELEREIISERTKASLASKRRRGVKLGRPKGISLELQHKGYAAEKLYKESNRSVVEICQELGISRPTFYKLKKEQNW